MSTIRHNATVLAEKLAAQIASGAYQQASIDLRAYDKGFALAALAALPDMVPPNAFRLFAAQLMDSLW